MSAMIDRLLDTAEADIRLRGYHAVSFRELAEQLGIKSASVHYYYRQKEDLGLALVERYAARFFEALAGKSAGAENYEDRLKAFIAVYREALVGSDRMCLCGVLGAENSGLPGALASAVAAFFQVNIDWLADAMPSEIPLDERRERANFIVATLQGAMLLATSLKDHRHFDAAADNLLRCAQDDLSANP